LLYILFVTDLNILLSFSCFIDETESVISSVSTHRSKRSTMSTVQVVTSWLFGTTEEVEVADDGSDGTLLGLSLYLHYFNHAL
jgi:hypothetical protein